LNKSISLLVSSITLVWAIVYSIPYFGFANIEQFPIGSSYWSADFPKLDSPYIIYKNLNEWFVNLSFLLFIIVSFFAGLNALKALDFDTRYLMPLSFPVGYVIFSGLGRILTIPNLKPFASFFIVGVILFLFYRFLKNYSYLLSIKTLRNTLVNQKSFFVLILLVVAFLSSIQNGPLHVI